MASLTANKPQFVVVGVTASFASLLIDATKVNKIYEEPQTAGGTFKSFNPLGGINSLTSFTSGRGYLIYPKTDLVVASLQTDSASFKNDTYTIPTII